MEQRLTLPPLKADIRMMKSICAVPIPVFAGLLMLSVVPYIGFVEVLMVSQIKSIMGIFGVIFVAFWVISLYTNFVEEDMKEVMLALPYKTMQLGMIRTLRMMGLYCLLFFPILFILAKLSRFVMNIYDVLFIMNGIFFFTSVSFVVILIVKSEMGAYGVIGLIAIYEYTTRGALTGWFYPFQWANNRPFYTWKEAVILFAISILLCLIAQWRLGNREYYVR